MGKSQTVSEYPTAFVVAMLNAIKRQMISDGVIKVEEMLFAGPVPDEGDNPTKFECKWGVDGTWIVSETADCRTERGNGVHDENGKVLRQRLQASHVELGR